MQVPKFLFAFFLRFRYPVSLPEDVAGDLGFNFSNELSFREFVNYLTDPNHRPTKLIRFMPREQAEQIFRTALRREHFTHHSLFSYYFNGGWMEFVLDFDTQSRLRRLYLRHKDIKYRHEMIISQ